MRTQQFTDDGVCRGCGEPYQEHEMDQFSGERRKCPIYRQEDTTPRGDY